MIDEMMNLQALLEKSADAELLREMIGFAAQRLMELEVEGPDRRGAWRTPSRPAEPAQRLPRPPVGDPGRDGGAQESKAQDWQLLPGLSRAAADGGEGADGGDPGGLCPGRLDALGRRSGQGDGDEPSRRARSRGCAVRSTTRSRPSSTGRWKATGPMSGWTRRI